MSRFETQAQLQHHPPPAIALLMSPPSAKQTLMSRTCGRAKQIGLISTTASFRSHRGNCVRERASPQNLSPCAETRAAASWMHPASTDFLPFPSPSMAVSSFSSDPEIRGGHVMNRRQPPQPPAGKRLVASGGGCPCFSTNGLGAGQGCWPLAMGCQVGKHRRDDGRVAFATHRWDGVACGCRSCHRWKLYGGGLLVEGFWRC